MYYLEYFSLEDHVETHGRYRCEICEKNFEIPELLSSHLCLGKVAKNETIIMDQKEERDQNNEETLYGGDDFEGRLEDQTKEYDV